MDGHREISIRIFLVWCRAIVEEVLKTFQTARKGSQDMTAGNNFLRQNGDPTITEEGKGFEELDFRQNKRSASYITGWIFMFYIKHWGPSVSKYSREGVEFETQPVSLAKYNSPKEQTEELPLSMVEYWRAQLYSKLLNWLFVHFGCFGSANPLGTEDLLSAERNRDRQLFTPTASLDSSSLISQSFQWKCTQALGEHMKSPAGWWITTLVTTALLSCLKKQWERERTSVCS